MKKLLWYQKKALKYGKTTEHPAFLMRMRTGKTLVTIRWVKKQKEISNVLVCCPLPVVETWEKHLNDEDEKYHRLWSLSRDKQSAALLSNFKKQHRKWFITNFDSIRAAPGICSNVNWDVVIVDEGKVIANPKSKIAYYFTEGFRDVKHRVLLTGILTPESEQEAFTQFKFLDGHFMGYDNFWEWRYKYFRKDFRGYKWIPQKNARTEIKNYVHARSFVLSRKDAGLHERWITHIYCLDMSKEQRSLYKKVKQTFAAELPEKTLQTKWATTRELWLYRICGGFDPEGKHIINTAGFDFLNRKIKEDFGDRKLVIWFRFRAELEYFSFICPYKCIKIYGDVKQDIRRERIEFWRKDKNIPLLLSTQATAKYGLDLSAASTEIYYSNEPSYNLRMQSRDRIYHPKKEETLTCIDICMKNTVSESLISLLNKKGVSEQNFLRLYKNLMRDILSR